MTYERSRLSSVVERVTFNPVAVGSIPTDGEETAIYFYFCKTLLSSAYPSLFFLISYQPGAV